MGELAKYIPINPALALNPVNWVIVFLMVLIGTVILCTLSGALGHANSNQGD